MRPTAIMTSSKGMSTFLSNHEGRELYLSMFGTFSLDAVGCSMTNLMIWAVLPVPIGRLLRTIISWCDLNPIAGWVLAPTRVDSNVFVIDAHVIALNISGSK